MPNGAFTLPATKVITRSAVLCHSSTQGKHTRLVNVSLRQRRNQFNVHVTRQTSTSYHGLPSKIFRNLSLSRCWCERSIIPTLNTCKLNLSPARRSPQEQNVYTHTHLPVVTHSLKCPLVLAPSQSTSLTSPSCFHEQCPTHCVAGKSG